MRPSSSVAGWLERGAPLTRVFGFDAIDRHVAELCSSDSVSLSERQMMFLLAGSVSRALRAGHACVLLSDLAGMEFFEHDDLGQPKEEPLTRLGDREELRRLVEISPAVMVQPWNTLPSVTSEHARMERAAVQFNAPLVFDGDDRLYAARLFEHELRLSESLAILLTSPAAIPSVDPEWRTGRLDHYFPPPVDQADGPDDQREAAVCALTQRLCIVSGGPGTGKTSTVVKILALLAEERLALGLSAPRLLLLAPTGKAAARLNESMESALARLDLPVALRQVIRPTAMTIHRALGVRPDSATRYVRNATYPFAADVVLIDEGSMVDLALMRHVCDALNDSARLVVLGDRHQLASVEAGSVFSELCTGLARPARRNVIELTRSFRFAKDSGIALLSAAIRDGEVDRVVQMSRFPSDDLQFYSAIDEARAHSALLRLCAAQYRAVSLATSPQAALETLSRFRVLCAHRQGPFGVEQLNREIAQYLVSCGLLEAYPALCRGQLLMVLENDVSLGLSNGDVAVLWPDAKGHLAACFSGEGGTIRRISPAQLPVYELCFAMTVHKSQGSEHETVAVVLPAAQSPVLSRELFYTAVTRAKKTAHVFASEASLGVAVRHRVARRSGLAQAVVHRSHKPHA